MQVVTFQAPVHPTLRQPNLQLPRIDDLTRGDLSHLSVHSTFTSPSLRPTAVRGRLKSRRDPQHRLRPITRVIMGTDEEVSQ